jgi:hypothetical protein
MKGIFGPFGPARVRVALTGLRTAGLLILLTVAGCACSERLAQAQPAETGAPREKPAPAAAPEAQPSATPPAAESAPPAEAPAPQADAPPAKAPKETPRPAAQAEPAPKQPTKPVAAAPLDLDSLEQRLKDTEAIGIMTKLTLKNQVDELLGRFEAHHDGSAKGPPTELRQPYDLLIMKVIALLQDRDAPLARAIVDSREAIWTLLSDRARFQTVKNKNRS